MVVTTSLGFVVVERTGTKAVGCVEVDAFGTGVTREVDGEKTTVVEVVVGSAVVDEVDEELVVDATDDDVVLETSVAVTVRLKYEPEHVPDEREDHELPLLEEIARG